MEQKQAIPFGLWKSPITPAMVSQGLSLQDVQFDSDGRTLLWIEGRSDRGVLVARQDHAGQRDISGDVLVRGGVGYGGGDFTIRKGMTIFAGRGGCLYRLGSEGGQPRPVTPPHGSIASPQLSPDGRWITYVWSDGQEDCLAVVDADGQDWPLRLARGADFYMQPVWNPRGDRLAWVEWNHPNMPWDGARLMLAGIAGAPPRLSGQIQIAGDQRTPVFQPEFSPDGRYLSYIVGNGEWDRLVIFDLTRSETRTLVEGDGYNLGLPAWGQGMRVYGWSADSRRIFYTRYAGAFATLWVVDTSSGQSSQIDVSPYTWIEQLAVSPGGNELAFLGSATDVPNRLVRWDGERVQVEAYSQTEVVPPEFLPKAREITWRAQDGTLVHGLYFAPSHPDFNGAGLPPAIVHVHGGPTSTRTAAYSPETAYFTSRGYGWLDVNYRGSIGYGRAYQDMLLERWGDVDVEDTVGGARALVEQGLADGSQLVVMGGSAGGYTVLNALIRHPGLFKAGVCEYGVSNLFTLAFDTHKFEAHYTFSMVGPLPEKAARYRDWSPVFHADQIRDPLALFQGADDRVVPPSQSEAIVKVLREKGIPHIYKLYAGEGHGFRKSETISDYLTEVENFLREKVIFAA